MWVITMSEIDILDEKCKHCGGMLDTFQYFHACECFACGYKWESPFTAGLDGVDDDE